VIHQANDGRDEARFIATEIKRIIAHSGNQHSFDDFSILLRFNALSRNIESALQSSGIPSRMVGGTKFFDRVEVKVRST
jgi:DNA helicase-2/ATP-dependent DNA helicase PcrA